MIGQWHCRFIRNGNAYVLSLKPDGRGTLARRGKTWQVLWTADDKQLTVRADHDLIEISLDSKRDGVYFGKNNWGKARMSRSELPTFK